MKKKGWRKPSFFLFLLVETLKILSYEKTIPIVLCGIYVGCLHTTNPTSFLRHHPSTQRNISIQFADFAMEGDKIIASATTKELKAMGWEYSCSSVPAAYLVGYLAGKRAIKEGVEYAVLDIGMQKVQHGGVLFATVAGMIDAGLEVPCSEDVLPDEDRLKGKHIDDAIEAAVDSIKQKMEAD